MLSVVDASAAGNMLLVRKLLNCQHAACWPYNILINNKKKQHLRKEMFYTAKNDNALYIKAAKVTSTSM